ncbi:MAG: hypothetical protein ACRD3F_14275 [Acidobacteriaceae bacterium]
MLNVLSICLPECGPDGCLRAFKSIERQGFVAAESFQWQGGSLRAWAHPSQLATENCVVRTSTGYACCVGPLWYRGRFGIVALQVLFNEAGEGRDLDETELRGNFALFIRNGRTCLFMNDALGLVRLYASPDRRFHSTSWLATCAYAGDVELDEDAAAEYVLLGASHSDRTVARNITTLPLAHAFDLTRGRARPRIAPTEWIGPSAPPTFEDAIDEADALLRGIFKEIASAFPGRVRAALSGGFDSRLIVAGLLACGERPELFVYGGHKSEDVPIARAVASGIGISIDIIDKDAINAQLAPPDIECRVQSALFFDGLPNDGIDDPGADQKTRLKSTAGGSLVPNGGGGEVLRNFFHLPDRGFHAIDIVRAFYRGFDRDVFRRSRGLPDYEDRMVSSIESTFGIGGEHVRRRLSREQVELIYPLFRCHHWMGVNNSVAVRHGHYLTPLIDLNTVRLASRLPLSWKNAGRLESRLITQFHAAIANQPSSYGFRFADGPDPSTRFKEWATCARPVFARPFINATRRRLHRQPVAPDVLARGRSLLPGEWRMDPVLDLTRLPDNVAFARALAVEIALRELVG